MGHRKGGSEDRGDGPAWEKDGKEGSGHGNQDYPDQSGDGQEQK
ncbi:hypothetical protein NOGI109294_03110 [Nocardiopsis gilva]